MATFSFLYATAQTNAVLIDVAPNERLTITRVLVDCDNANTADVGVSLALAGADMAFTGHPGIAAGSGYAESYRPGEVEGALGQKLLFTCEAPSSGAVRVSGSYTKRVF